MANLWLYNSKSQTISPGDTITIYAKLDPTTVMSSISSYTAKIRIDGVLYGYAESWEEDGSSSNWITECSYTFEDAGTYSVGIALCNASGSYLGEKTGTITITVEKAIPSTWYWESAIGGSLNLTEVGTNAYEIYPLTASEWNDFLSRIEEWVDYFGTTYWASIFADAYASKGTTMLASQAQAAVSLLEALNPPTSPPDAPLSGGVMTAAFVNGLASSLNSLRKKA